jgi:hypothetical protein
MGNLGQDIRFPGPGFLPVASECKSPFCSVCCRESRAKFLRTLLKLRLFLWLPFLHGYCHSIISRMKFQCLDSPNFQRSWCEIYGIATSGKHFSLYNAHTLTKLSQNQCRIAGDFTFRILTEYVVKPEKFSCKSEIPDTCERVSRQRCTLHGPLIITDGAKFLKGSFCKAKDHVSMVLN